MAAAIIVFVVFSLIIGGYCGYYHFRLSDAETLEIKQGDMLPDSEVDKIDISGNGPFYKP